MNRSVRLAAVLVVLAASLFFLASPSSAKLVVNTSTRSEMVWGRSEQELQSSIVDHVFSTAENSPTAAAMCGAMPEVKFTIRHDGERYKLESWVVKLAIVYYYPKWGNVSYAGSSLREKWATYLRVLKIHEETHGAIAKKYARMIDKALGKVHSATKPEVIKAEVDMTFADIWAEQHQAQVQFDATSNPVRFPLPQSFEPLRE